MDLIEIKEFLSSVQDTIYLIRPNYSAQSENCAESKLLRAVLIRAIDDLEYLFNPEVSREHFNYGRSALTWIFAERADALSKIYSNPSKFRQRKLQITSFDSICHWLEINPDQLRTSLCSYFPLKFLSCFLPPFQDSTIKN